MRCLFALCFFTVSLTRISLQPFTFSNGVTIPAGTFVTVPGTAVQTDGKLHADSGEFDGFRFAKLREIEGDTTTASKYQSVSPSSEYLVYGLGRHSWWVLYAACYSCFPSTERVTIYPSAPDDSLWSMK